MTVRPSPGKLGWHSLGSTFECACGQTHSIPIRVCHIGVDAAREMAAYAQDRCGKRVLVISDENTRQASGDEPLSALSVAGKHVEEHVFGSETLDATGEVCETVRHLAEDVDFIVALGAGTLSDLAKYAGSELNKPVLLYPTAASMNGYTSAIVAVKIRGLKRTIPCAPAEAVFGNPEVIAGAPRLMTAAGVGDFLSKCSSSTDWRMAHALRSVYYCSRPREFFEGVQGNLIDAAHGLNNAQAHGVVLDALLLSGLSMVMAGSSAPASGGEHLISHYLDMKAALDGTPNDLHGAQVGVATIHCLRLWEKIFALNPGGIDIEKCLANQLASEEIARAIDRDWGGTAPEVHEQWKEKELSREDLRLELQRFKGGLDEMKETCTADLLPAATVQDAIRAAGGPVAPSGLKAPIEEYNNALARARYIRNRFTVLDLATELCIERETE